MQQHSFYATVLLCTRCTFVHHTLDQLLRASCTYISAAERNTVIFRHPVEERRISAHGRRTSYLGARTKNAVSRRADEERRISPYTGHVLAVKPPRYDVLRPRGEIRCSSSMWRDTAFFVGAPRYDVVPLSRRYTINDNRCLQINSELHYTMEQICIFGVQQNS